MMIVNMIFIWIVLAMMQTIALCRATVRRPEARSN